MVVVAFLRDVSPCPIPGDVRHGKVFEHFSMQIRLAQNVGRVLIGKKTTLPSTIWNMFNLFFWCLGGGVV